MKLWDFFRPPDRNEIAKWAHKEKLTPPERGQLNQKLDMLERLGFDTAWGLDFLDGPVRHQGLNQRHVYKLVIHAGRQLRPMLCRGPLAESEMTLLCGAFEKDGEFDPWDAPTRAEQNRQIILEQNEAGNGVSNFT
ncbi:MAG: hypothetical protein ABSB35_18670 [Bryobacteraceae bacterium]|jgi:hypothetical protein